MKPTKKMVTKKTNTNTQSGNIFFYILVGVALFAALAFAISKGMRGQTSSTLGKRNTDIAISDIMSQAHKIESAISTIRRKNISESDICFESNLFSTTNNNAYSMVSTCSQENYYNLFHPDGGNLSIQDISLDLLDKKYKNNPDYAQWVFTNVNGVQDIGNSEMSDPSSMELIAFVSYLKKDVCQIINNKLGIGTIIPENGGAFSTNPVDSGFTSTSGEISAAELQGKYSGCFQHDNDIYIFYHVLIER